MDAKEAARIVDSNNFDESQYAELYAALNGEIEYVQQFNSLKNIINTRSQKEDDQPGVKINASQGSDDVPPVLGIDTSDGKADEWVYEYKQSINIMGNAQGIRPTAEVGSHTIRVACNNTILNFSAADRVAVSVLNPRPESFDALIAVAKKKNAKIKLSGAMTEDFRTALVIACARNGITISKPSATDVENYAAALGKNQSSNDERLAAAEKRNQQLAAELARAEAAFRASEEGKRNAEERAAQLEQKYSQLEQQLATMEQLLQRAGISSSADADNSEGENKTPSPEGHNAFINEGDNPNDEDFVADEEYFDGDNNTDDEKEDKRQKVSFWSRFGKSKIAKWAIGVGVVAITGFGLWGLRSCGNNQKGDVKAAKMVNIDQGNSEDTSKTTNLGEYIQQESKTAPQEWFEGCGMSESRFDTMKKMYGDRWDEVWFNAENMSNQFKRNDINIAPGTIISKTSYLVAWTSKVGKDGKGTLKGTVLEDPLAKVVDALNCGEALMVAEMQKASKMFDGVNDDGSLDVAKLQELAAGIFVDKAGTARVKTFEGPCDENTSTVATFANVGKKARQHRYVTPKVATPKVVAAEEKTDTATTMRADDNSLAKDLVKGPGFTAKEDNKPNIPHVDAPDKVNNNLAIGSQTNTDFRTPADQAVKHADALIAKGSDIMSPKQQRNAYKQIARLEKSGRITTLQAQKLREQVKGGTDSKNYNGQLLAAQQKKREATNG